MTTILRKIGVKTVITATRKTSPGMRLLDKEGRNYGGGNPHRIGLYDRILIKDNHIAVVGNASECVRKARKQVGRTRN